MVDKHNAYGLMEVTTGESTCISDGLLERSISALANF